MDFITDLHLHSKYSRACSERLNLESMDKAAKEKGINVIATGDYTHPKWFSEIKSKLEEEDGLCSLKGSSTGTKFILSVEIANIYSGEHMAKKVHNCVLAPTIDAAEQFDDILGKRGNLSADGRPIIGMSSSELVEIAHGIDAKMEVIPAHIWTPYFGALGSMSGYDSIEAAYEDQAMHIHAVETGLSSDPGMNWRVSSLDKYALVSNSDAHSLQKMGREANVFSFESEDRLTYDSIIAAIREKDKKHFKITIEFYPEEGKYHNDGHRACGVSLDPVESKRLNGVCPKCHKRLTIGVLHRVEELADRPMGYKPKDAIPFVHAVPLVEVLSEITGKGPATQRVTAMYTDILDKFGDEFHFLLNSDTEKIALFDKELAQGIGNMRSENVTLVPGYDGVFGVVDIMNKVRSEKQHSSQKNLFGEPA